MKTIRTSHQNQATETPSGDIKSKAVQSLGWIDTLLGDKKARRAAQEKAAARHRRGSN